MKGQVEYIRGGHRKQIITKKVTGRQEDRKALLFLDPDDMYSFYFRLLMPSMVRVLLNWVLARRRCLKRNKSLWILKQMERRWRMDGQFLQILTLG